MFSSCFSTKLSVISFRSSKRVEYKIISHDNGVKTFELSPRSDLLGFIDENASFFLVSLLSIKGPSGKQYIGSNEVSRVGGATKPELVRNIKSGFKLSWHPTIPIIAIPSISGSIILLWAEDEQIGLYPSYEYLDEQKQTSWKELMLVTSPNTDLSHGSNHINLVEFSPNGRYMVSVDITGTTLVWELKLKDISSSMPIAKVSNTSKSSLYDIAWGRDIQSNYLIGTTLSSWFCAKDVINTSLGFVKPADSSLVPTQVSQTAAETSNKPITSSSTFSRLKKAGVTTASLLSPPAKSLSSLALDSESNETITENKDDDESVAFDDPETSEETKTVSIKEIKRQLSNSTVKKPTVHFSKEDLIDDDNSIENDKEVSRIYAEARASMKGTASIPSNIVGKSIPTINMQDPFQPSCSKPDSLLRRYLVWNHVGNITSRDESVSNRIEIRFSNSFGNNRQEAFPDTYGFTKGSLSFEGAFFASDADVKESDESNLDNDEKISKGSVLYYHAFPSQNQLQGCNESFTYHLNDAENALCVAVGRGWAAAATSMNLLRIFSSTGIQLSIVQLPGKIVSMTGCDQTLAVFYHRAMPFAETQMIAVDVYHINTLSSETNSIELIVQNRQVPLQSKSTLEWIGYDMDLSAVVMLDSMGMLNILMKAHSSHPNIGWQWIPVLDISKIRKSIDYIYWPIMVKGGKFAFVLLNGETKPSIYPQPVVSVKPFKIPIIQITDGKDKGEAANERNRLTLWENMQLSHLDNKLMQMQSQGVPEDSPEYEHLQTNVRLHEKEADKAILKAMQEACRLQRVGHALDLVQKLRLEISLAAAIKVADHFGMVKVAEVVEKIIEFRQQMEASKQIAMEENDDNDMPVSGRNDNQSMETRTQSRHDIAASDSMRYDEASSQYDYSSQDIGTTMKSQSDGITLKVKPSNPFAVKNVSSPSSNKRKNAFDSIQEMKGSPSPKKPLISVSCIQ